MTEVLRYAAFTTDPAGGNPAGVVLDAAGLDDAAMQAIARWTRLPETTFVFPATSDEASYRIRMFSPRREVPFAGHPSVGTAHVVLASGMTIAGATLCLHFTRLPYFQTMGVPCAIGTLVAVWRWTSERRLRLLSFLLAAGIPLQAVIGGMSVKYRDT